MAPTQLAADIRAAAAELVALVGRIDSERWARVPAPGAWSAGKEVEHVAEGLQLHTWVVRLSLGEAVSSRRPRVERKVLTTALLAADAAALIHERAEEAATLVQALTDEQLTLPTKPPRAGDQPLGVTIERMLIGHIHSHRATIEVTLSAPPA